MRDGLVVAIPTDTVYGLAVDPFRPGATEGLFALKRRPRGVDLAVLIGSLEQLDELVGVVPGHARRLIERFWPGPLTIVLPRRPGLTIDLGAHDATVGVRWPRHPVAEALSLAAGPLGVTSANRHGEEPSATAEEAAAVGDGVALALDGGPCRGTPSTVVDCTGEDPVVLREGDLSHIRLQKPV